MKRIQPRLALCILYVYVCRGHSFSEIAKLCDEWWRGEGGQFI